MSHLTCAVDSPFSSSRFCVAFPALRFSMDQVPPELEEVSCGEEVPERTTREAKESALTSLSTKACATLAQGVSVDPPFDSSEFEFYWSRPARISW